MERLPLASAAPLAPCAPPLSLFRRQPTLLLPCRPATSRRFRFRALAHGSRSEDRPPQRFSLNAPKQIFASVSSSSNSETTSVGPPQFPLPPPTMSLGGPLIWIGVGVGLSALFSWGTTYLKQYVMNRAMATMMENLASGNSNAKNSGFSPSSYPFPSAPFPPPPASSAPGASRSVTTIDVTSTKVEATTTTEVRDDFDKASEKPKKYAFVDVLPDEISQEVDSADSGIPIKDSSKGISDFSNEVVSNGRAVKQDESSSKEQSQSRKAAPGLSVDALEKMMEDPTVQKMVYPYLPEEMRNPTTFKWMLQNPQYRQQLQDMLNNMGGGGDWDNKIMDSLKSFDLSSPEVKQQFDQIGLTPEEVISKIMANPELALAFQNPKVQAAIMDCSQNPFSISKYQNDKEVMDVFNKISELFPGVTGTL